MVDPHHGMTCGGLFCLNSIIQFISRIMLYGWRCSSVGRSVHEAWTRPSLILSVRGTGCHCTCLGSQHLRGGEFETSLCYAKPDLSKRNVYITLFTDTSTNFLSDVRVFCLNVCMHAICLPDTHRDHQVP